LAGLGQRRQVFGPHDLADAGSESLSEHGHVEPTPHQDDAHLWPTEPELLGDVQGGGQLNIGSNDQEPLGRIIVQLTQGRRAGLDDPEDASQGKPDVVSASRVALPQNAHDCSLPMVALGTIG
jgi:hypothetical protein